METGRRQTDTNVVTISLVYTVANLFLVPNFVSIFVKTSVLIECDFS